MEGGEEVMSEEMRKRTLELSFRRPFLLLILPFKFSSFFLSSFFLPHLLIIGAKE